MTHSEKIKKIYSLVLSPLEDMQDGEFEMITNNVLNDINSTPMWCDVKYGKIGVEQSMLYIPATEHTTLFFSLGNYMAQLKDKISISLEDMGILDDLGYEYSDYGINFTLNLHHYNGLPTIDMSMLNSVLPNPTIKKYYDKEEIIYKFDNHKDIFQVGYEFGCFYQNDNYYHPDTRHRVSLSNLPY